MKVRSKCQYRYHGGAGQVIERAAETEGAAWTNVHDMGVRDYENSFHEVTFR